MTALLYGQSKVLEFVRQSSVCCGGDTHKELNKKMALACSFLRILILSFPIWHKLGQYLGECLHDAEGRSSYRVSAGSMGGLQEHTTKSGSIKIARSMTQLNAAQPVCKAKVSVHLVRRDSKLSQLAAGVVPHANTS